MNLSMNRESTRRAMMRQLNLVQATKSLLGKETQLWKKKKWLHDQAYMYELEEKSVQLAEEEFQKAQDKVTHAREQFARRRDAIEEARGRVRIMEVVVKQAREKCQKRVLGEESGGEDLEMDENPQVEEADAKDAEEDESGSEEAETGSSDGASKSGTIYPSDGSTNQPKITDSNRRQTSVFQTGFME
ncbi:unnamed protein product [Periconia digitata]|uniref:Uncharacterized protein n=1 Tax=Periconia digitata TaxID=1303443 RepID=A0A9W4U5B2_9PLEO|nr:unnamed protein product [Periconia digitata]